MTETLIQAWRNYMAAIYLDGDYLNDWLTHLPYWIRPLIMFTGKIAALLGGF